MPILLKYACRLPPPRSRPPPGQAIVTVSDLRSPVIGTLLPSCRRAVPRRRLRKRSPRQVLVGVLSGVPLWPFVLCGRPGSGRGCRQDGPRVDRSQRWLHEKCDRFLRKSEDGRRAALSPIPLDKSPASTAGIEPAACGLGKRPGAGNDGTGRWPSGRFCRSTTVWRRRTEADETG